MKRSFAVVGCGTAGQAVSILLARLGHDVSVFERAERLRPVGAGLLLQPTGCAVLDRLGVMDEIRRLATPIQRLLGHTSSGRKIMDLAYEDLRRGLTGFGVQRAAISQLLEEQMRSAGVTLHLGVEVENVEGDSPTLCAASGDRHGPFDMLIACDGARSRLRRLFPEIVKRDDVYPWGALWFIGDDPDGHYEGVLRQTYRGSREMIGFLPSGSTPTDPRNRVSLFWSIRAKDWEGPETFDLDAWKARALELDEKAGSLLDQIDDPEQLIFASYHDAIVRPSHEGHVVFLGDAGHAMSPQLGQGVNLALLDAAALADAIEQYRDITPAFRAFDRARRRNVSYYHRASRWLTPFFQADASFLPSLRDCTLGAFCRAPYVKRQALLSLAGVKTGLFSASLASSVLTRQSRSRQRTQSHA